jgi:hypothetical protein
VKRAEHLQWAKDRAIEYVKRDELGNAYASMMSDLNKHPDTRNHPALLIGTQLLITGNLNTPEQMKHFIEGIN